MPSKNDWNEYKRLLLDFKDNTQQRLDAHDRKLDKILQFMGGMKVKLAIGTSVIAGLVSYIVASIK